MADRSRRISRGALNTVEDSTEPQHEDILTTSSHSQTEHEDSHSGSNVLSAILNRWLMSNTFYSSSVNSFRFK